MLQSRIQELGSGVYILYLKNEVYPFYREDHNNRCSRTYQSVQLKSLIRSTSSDFPPVSAIMLSKSLQPNQVPRSTKHPSTSSQNRQPHTAIKATGRAASNSPLPRRITNPNPNEAHLSQAISAAQTRSIRGRPLSALGNGGVPPSGPLDSEIAQILMQNKRSERYLDILRAGILSHALMSYDKETELFTEAYDMHIAQLVRVLDELKRTGECIVGGRIVRPGA
jgi:hypothetical protein